MPDCQNTVNSISESLVIVYGKRTDLTVRSGFVFRNDRWRSKTNACRRANRSEAMMTERLAQQGKPDKGANYETGKDPGRLCPV